MTVVSAPVPLSERITDYKSGEYPSAQDIDRPAQDTSEKSLRVDIEPQANVTNVHRNPPPTYFQSQHDMLLDRLKRLSAYAKLTGQVSSTPQDQSHHFERDLSDDSQYVFERTDEFEDPLDAQLREVSRPAAGTCQWVFETPQYKLAKEGRAVFVLIAPPGVGKTVLAKSICEDLKSKTENRRLVSFFCKRKVIGRSSTITIAATFLYRLLQDDAAQDFLRRREASSSSSLSDHQIRDLLTGSEMPLKSEELWQLFSEISRQPFASKYVFLIDGLDECTDSKDLAIALRLMKNNYSADQAVHLFITSRRDIAATMMAHDFPATTVDADASRFSDDAERFVLGNLQARGISDATKEELARKIKQKILEGAEGLFLLLSCRLDELETRINRRKLPTSDVDLEQLLNQPFDPVLEYFAKMLDDMLDLEKYQSGIQLLDIILTAQNPLTKAELAVAYSFANRQFSTQAEYSLHRPQNIFLEAKLLCGSLVKLQGNEEEETGTIDLVHEKARELLERDQITALLPHRSDDLDRIGSAQGHVMMATACMRSLLSENIIGERWPEDIKFLLYSISHWPTHVGKTGAKISEYLPLLATFLSSGRGYSLWADFWSSIEEERTGERPGRQSFAYTIVEYDLVNVLDILDHLRALDCPVDLDQKDDIGRTALLEAITQEKFDVADRLLDLGADPTIADNDGVTAVHLAALRGHSALIRKLKIRGADLDAETIRKVGTVEGAEHHAWSPLWWSLYGPDSSVQEIFELLYSLGARKTIRSDDHWPIILGAASIAQVHVLKFILDNGYGSVHDKAPDGLTVLMIAACQDDGLEVVKFLVTCTKVDVDATTTDGKTAFWFALCEEQLNNAVYLLPLTQKLDAPAVEPGVESRGWTPLHLCAAVGYVDIGRELIRRNAKIDAPTETGATPLLIAIGNEQDAFTHMLMHKGASVDLADDAGGFPLFAASVENQLDVVKALLQAKANTMATKRGISALHMAAWEGNLELVQCFIDSRRSLGQSIDEVEETSGYTPLICSLRQDKPDVARLLILSDADVNAISSTGLLPLHFFCWYCKDEALLDLLLSKVPGDHINFPTNSGSTPLHLAARYEFAYGVARLIELKADVAARNENAQTPLMHAAASGAHIVVDLILKEDKCMPDARDKLGWTALHFACESCKDYNVIDRLTKATNWQDRKRSTVTPLSLAVMLQNRPAVEALLANNMPADFGSDDGVSPLYEAAELGFDMVELLLRHGAQKDVTSGYNITPYLVALENGDEQVIKALTPNSMNMLRRRADTNLADSLIQATRYNGETVKWLVHAGLPPYGRALPGINALHSAAEYHNWLALDELLEISSMWPLVDSVSDITRRTPLILAAQARSPECVKILIQKGSADVRLKDILGLSALDYALPHEATREMLRELDKPAYDAWLEEPLTPEMILTRLRHLLAWFRSLSNVIPYYYRIKDFFFDLIAMMLLYLRDEPNGLTALERTYGRPSDNRPNGLRCSFCLKWKRKPGFICSRCPHIMLCASCQSDEDKMKNIGCSKHKILPFPREDWAKRDPLHVNDKEEIEEVWLDKLVEEYGVKDLEEQMCADVPEANARTYIKMQTTKFLDISWEYSDSRENVFDLCRQGRWDEIKSHLLRYPRDVALRNAQGDNMAMHVLRDATEDGECLRLLETLRAEAVEVLFRNTEGETTITIACEKDFVQCLTFILSNYDREFNLAEDKGSSQAMSKMIERDWDDALRFAIDRHFGWASRGTFHYLHQVDRLGLNTGQIIELLKDVQTAVEPPGTPQDQPQIFLMDFEQPLTGNSPDPSKHIRSCLHEQCHNGYTAEEQFALDQSRDPSTSSSEWILERTESTQDQESLQSFSSVSDTPSVTDKVAYLCGLAGIFAKDKGSWSIKAHSGIQTAFVRYTREDNVEFDLQAVLELLIKAGRGLLEAMFCVQSAKMCCNTFTVLCDIGPADSTDSTPLIELCKIPCPAVSNFVQDVVNNALEILAGTERDLLSGQGTNALDEIKTICSFTHRSPPSTTLDQVDEASKMMQFLCLGFCSYLGAHSSRLTMPVITPVVPPVVMEGIGGTGVIAFRPRKLACVGEMLRQDVGVFCERPDASSDIFDESSEGCSVLAHIDDFLEIWGPGQCLFKTEESSSNGIIAVALRHGFLALSDHSTSGPRSAHWSSSSMLGIRKSSNGNEDGGDWKLPTSDGQFMSGDDFLSGTAQAYDKLLSFKATEVLRIAGGLGRNRRCTLKGDETRQMRIYATEQDAGKTCYLGSFLPGWALRNLQGNVGVQAPHVGVSGAMGFDKLSGASKKAGVVKNFSTPRAESSARPHVWSSEDFSVLSRPYGVIFSICSNYARRVPLREALAEAWPFFTVDWSSDWQRLGDVVRQRLKGERPSWLSRSRDFDPEFELRWLITRQGQRTQTEIRNVIIEIMGTLSFTGVALDGETFRIAWPQMDDPRAGYEFRCSEVQACWVRLLQDTTSIVTFAILTNDCLVYERFQDRECRNHRRDNVRLQALALLDTKIIEENAAGPNWQLPGTCTLIALGPATARSISLTTKIACEVLEGSQGELELIVLGDAVIMGRIYNAARWVGLTKRLHEVGHQPRVNKGWSLPAVVTQYEDWKYRPLCR